MSIMGLFFSSVAPIAGARCRIPDSFARQEAPASHAPRVLRAFAAAGKAVYHRGGEAASATTRQGKEATKAMKMPPLQFTAPSEHATITAHREPWEERWQRARRVRSESERTQGHVNGNRVDSRKSPLPRARLQKRRIGDNESGAQHVGSRDAPLVERCSIALPAFSQGKSMPTRCCAT